MPLFSTHEGFFRSILFHLEVPLEPDESIDKTQYIEFDESTGAVNNPTIFWELKPCFSYPDPKKYKKVYIPRWFVLLFKSMGSKQRRFNKYLTAHVDFLKRCVSIWEATKDFAKILEVTKEVGFDLTPPDLILKFHYRNTIHRYFIKDNCWEQCKSINAWKNTSLEFQNKTTPCSEEERKQFNIAVFYLNK